MLWQEAPRRNGRMQSQLAKRVRTLAAIALLVPFALGAQQPAEQRPGTYTVKRGDTLWDLAKHFLNDPYLWPQIYRLNTDQIRDPHWIYPGELLNLPQAVAVAPAAAPAPTAEEPASDFNGPTVFAPQPRRVVTSTIEQRPLVEPAPVVRQGEYLAAPYVERLGRRRGTGKIMGSSELEGVASAADPGRYQLFSKIFIAPPAGTAAAEGDRFVAVAEGPEIEGLGRIVIPTGVVRVTKATHYGEAAVAEVVQIFNEVRPGQQLLPYDSTALALRGQPRPIQGGRWSSVQWIYSQPVLPAVQSYMVLNVNSRDGVKIGDRFELFKSRQNAAEPAQLAESEIPIAYGNAVRVTPYATTIILTGEDQPKIRPGTLARITAQMP